MKMKFGASVLALFAYQGATAFQPAAPKPTETALFSAALLRSTGASGSGSTVCRPSFCRIMIHQLLIAFVSNLSLLFLNS